MAKAKKKSRSKKSLRRQARKLAGDVRAGFEAAAKVIEDTSGSGSLSGPPYSTGRLESRTEFVFVMPRVALHAWQWHSSEQTMPAWLIPYIGFQENTTIESCASKPFYRWIESYARPAGTPIEPGDWFVYAKDLSWPEVRRYSDSEFRRIFNYPAPEHFK